MKQRLFAVLAALVLLTGCSACAGGSVYAGREFTFGSYEQDGNRSNGPEPIVWIVVDVDAASGTCTAVSKYLLDCVQYHTSTATVSWHDTSLNRWLYSWFIPSAFSAGERAALIPTRAGSSWEEVFIPSEEEMYRYFRGDYLCEPTRYAISRGVYSVRYQGRICGSYWLRRNVSSTWGTFVGAHGGIYNQRNNKVTVTDNGVRPAITLSLYSFPF